MAPATDDVRISRPLPQVSKAKLILGPATVAPLALPAPSCALIPNPHPTPQMAYWTLETNVRDFNRTRNFEPSFNFWIKAGYLTMPRLKMMDKTLLTIASSTNSIKMTLCFPLQFFSRAPAVPTPLPNHKSQPREPFKNIHRSMTLPSQGRDGPSIPQPFASPHCTLASSLSSGPTAAPAPVAAPAPAAKLPPKTGGRGPSCSAGPATPPTSKNFGGE